ncbi:MAG: cytochrome P450 [Myxococcales bacterium]|nr:cytochrome P450 [Myxococcales bacterium]
MTNSLSSLAELWPSPTRAGFPCMPDELPVVGHALALHLDAVGALRRAREQCGPLFWVHLGFGARFLFCTGSGSFELMKDPRLVTDGARSTLEYLIGRSLLSLDGAAHRRIRGVLNPPFAPRGLSESVTGDLIRQVATDRAERLVQQDQAAIHEEMKEMALDLVLRIAGVGTQDLPEWRHQYSEAMLGLVPLPWDLPYSPRRRALRGVAWLNKQISALLERARAETKGNSLLHVLLQARDENGRALDEAELLDNIRTLFLAGHETTATTAAWAVLHLCLDPGLWQRMVDEACRGSGVPRSPAEAKQFPLAEAIFRESVRLYGPAWFINRRTTAVIEHAGHPIPANTTVAVTPSLWARDPDLYPEPDVFRPERWLGRPSPTPYEISQFGAGAHFCLGYHLAWLEVVAFLVALGRSAQKQAPGQRPRLFCPEALRPRFFPTPHPPTVARVSFRATAAIR